MEVAQRISDAGPTLTTAERRVAEVVLGKQELVAFGTVADLADAAGAGAATVVRLAVKLAYDGFSALQAAVQRDLSNQLRPAAERIREAKGGANINAHIEREIANVQATLHAVDATVLVAAVEHLANIDRPLVVVSGDASTGVCQQFLHDVQSMRSGAELLTGNQVAVARRVALCEPGDCVVVVDLARYDRWVIEAVTQARERQAWILAITDSVLSPLAGLADATLLVSAGALSPFDSHVGTLALMNLLITGLASSLRTVATKRLDSAERAWKTYDQLVDR